MKIGKIAQASGLSVDTLRFYEKIGLIPPPARDDAGRRDYDPGTLDWIGFLGRLAATGMKQADRVRYAAFRRQGDRTLAARRAMLEAHRKVIVMRLAELTDALALMDAKIAIYRAQEAAFHTGEAP
jgi:DNA-binding transcriptional MerR regulator